MAKGYVVEVTQSGIVIATNPEFLDAIGLPGTFVKIQRGSKRLVGIVSAVSLSEEIYRSSRGRIPLLETYRELALKRNEVLITPLATIEDGKLERKLSFIPSPGEEATTMNENELRGIFSSGDIKIGRLINKDVEVLLDINELATKHLAILAMTGSGKSNTLAVLMLRILQRFKNPRVVVIDTHSEYLSLKDADPERIRIFAPAGDLLRILSSQGISVKPIEVPYWLLSLEEWYSLLRLDQRATVQRRVLREALREVKRGSPNAPIKFDLKELLRALERMSNDVRQAQEVKMKLEDAIDTPEYEFIFYPSVKSEDPVEALKSILLPFLSPGINIIALGGLPTDAQNAVVSALLRFLFRFFVEGKIQGISFPLLLAIEEAHIYAPENSWTAAKQIIERIAKEGRKFGVGLIIVSQRPREISQTVLAQCGNLIALRTVNPEDKRHILNSMEDISDVMTASLSSLGRGEALLTGPFIPIPAMVKIDRFEDVAMEYAGRAIKLGGKDIDFRLSWEEDFKEEDVEKVLKAFVDIEMERIRRDEEGKGKKGGADLTSFFG